MRSVYREAIVDRRFSGERFDRVAAELFAEFSRSQLQRWIREGALSLDGQKRVRPGYRLAGCERMRLEAVVDERTEDLPEAVALAVVYEDNDVLVVDKPAGMVVHPGAGNPAGTLVNALLYYDRSLGELPRAGIVHRLDKLTSGLLLVARNDPARRRLAGMLKARAIRRSYTAVVWGTPPAHGTIDAALGRHPVDRKRMAVRTAAGSAARTAVTRYRLQRRLGPASLLEVELATGRTHQIRVHMRHIGHPLVGDPVYGKRTPPADSRAVRQDLVLQALYAFPRQALHAGRLRFAHPVTGAPLDLRSPLPDDLSALLALLEQKLDGQASGD